MKLFLDDIRDPPDPDWTIVRSVEAAIAHIRVHGVPDHVSFDHDLGDVVPSGMDLAKWLVEQHLDGTHLIPANFSFQVHSANPPGRANIIGLLDQFLSKNRRGR